MTRIHLPRLELPWPPGPQPFRHPARAIRSGCDVGSISFETLAVLQAFNGGDDRTAAYVPPSSRSLRRGGPAMAAMDLDIFIPRMRDLNWPKLADPTGLPARLTRSQRWAAPLPTQLVGGSRWSPMPFPRCHLLVEKPPARSTPGLARLATAADATGVTGMVAHNLRHSAAWKRTWERIEPSSVEGMTVTYHASGPTGERWGLPPHEAFILTHAIPVFDLFNAALGPPRTTTHHLNDVGHGRFVLSSQWHSQRDVIGTAVISTCAPRFDWNAQLVTTNQQLVRISSPSELVIQGPRQAGAWGGGPAEHLGRPSARRRLHNRRLRHRAGPLSRLHRRPRHPGAQSHRRARRLQSARRPLPADHTDQHQANSTRAR